MSRYSIRYTNGRNPRYFDRIEDVYRELPAEAKVGAPDAIGDRPVFFEGRRPFAHIERHGTARTTYVDADGNLLPEFRAA